MADEGPFLNAILANPTDDAPRLVYADWLDECGDEHSVHKATFLRMTARLLTARSDLGRRYWEDKLRAAAAGLEGHWLTVVSKVSIEGCSFLFAFRCPKRWENLRESRDPNVRHCDTCGKPVHFSSTIAEAQEHARRGECVAVSLAVPRSPGDLDRHSAGRRFTPDQIRELGQQMMTLGHVAPEPAAQQAPPTVPPEPVHDRPRRCGRRPELRRQRRRRHLMEDDN